jgi:predicted site-specific integrase-resolvase
MDYITTKKASALWGYKEATIRKWCKEGKISVVCKAEKKVVSGKSPLTLNVQNL